MTCTIARSRPATAGWGVSSPASSRPPPSRMVACCSSPGTRVRRRPAAVGTRLEARSPRWSSRPIRSWDSARSRTKRITACCAPSRTPGASRPSARLPTRRLCASTSTSSATQGGPDRVLSAPSRSLHPGDLADLDEVAVWITDIGANLSPVVFGVGQELGAFGRPFLVGLLDVGNPDVHKGAGAVRVLWGFECDRRLVIGWPATGVQDQPCVRDLEDHGISLQHYLAVEDLLIEVA